MLGESERSDRRTYGCEEEECGVYLGRGDLGLRILLLIQIQWVDELHLVVVSQVISLCRFSLLLFAVLVHTNFIPRYVTPPLRTRSLAFRVCSCSCFLCSCSCSCFRSCHVIIHCGSVMITLYPPEVRARTTVPVHTTIVASLQENRLSRWRDRVAPRPAQDKISVG